MDEHGKLESYTPDLRPSDYCRQILLEISRQPIPVGITSKRYRYSGSGPADIEHAHLARRAGVSAFHYGWFFWALEQITGIFARVAWRMSRSELLEAFGQEAQAGTP